MLKIKSYVKVNSIAEAYELNQKKTACVLGGMVWLKMGNRNISTAIDLSRMAPCVYSFNLLSVSSALRDVIHPITNSSSVS